MNGLVALCHFCEQHGPSVVFCTQAFHVDPEWLPVHPLQQAVSPSKLSLPSLPSQTSISSSNFSSSTPSIASILSNFPILSQMDEKEENASQKQPSCPACSSVGENERGFITYDNNAKTMYVGTRYPVDQKLYGVVRQACVRSLSCELSPGREGPVLFGDDKTGYVLSYLFKIHDSLARGQQRCYSLIFLMTDRIHLVASWPFLIGNFKVLVAQIQAKAAKVFDKEMATRKKSQTLLLSRTNSPLTPDQFLRRRGTQQLRSLLEIVGQPNFFIQIHAAFGWILKASANRLFEKQLEGAALTGSSMKLKQPVASSQTSVDQLSHLDLGRETSDLSETTSISSELGDTLRAKHEEKFKFMPQPEFTSLLEIRRVLTQDNFRILVHNVVTGNQVIVRGDSYSLVASALTTLQTLLPPGCCRVIEYERTYQEVWKCNFLGLVGAAEIPSDLDPLSYVMLDIRFDSYDDFVNTTTYSNNDPGTAKFKRFFFQVTHGLPKQRTVSKLTSGDQSNQIGNSYTTQLEASISQNPSPQLFNIQMLLLREEWINKSKLFFKLSKSVTNNADDKIKKFMKVLSLRDSDLILLKFWTAGLGKHHRAKLLATPE